MLCTTVHFWGGYKLAQCCGRDIFYKSKHLKMLKSFGLAISPVEISSVEDVVSMSNYVNIDHNFSYNIKNMQGGS